MTDTHADHELDPADPLSTALRRAAAEERAQHTPRLAARVAAALDAEPAAPAARAWPWWSLAAAVLLALVAGGLWFRARPDAGGATGGAPAVVEEHTPALDGAPQRARAAVNPATWTRGFAPEASLTRELSSLTRDTQSTARFLLGHVRLGPAQRGS